MPAGNAINMLQQLMQQLQSDSFATNAMNQLSGAGLGKLKPKKFFSTPFDEQILRSAVLGNVLGFYGGNQGLGVGNPFAALFGGNFDPFTGGQREPFFMQGQNQNGNFPVGERFDIPAPRNNNSNGFTGVPDIGTFMPAPPGAQQNPMQNLSGLPDDLFANIMGFSSPQQMQGQQNGWGGVPTEFDFMQSGGNMLPYTQAGNPVLQQGGNDFLYNQMSGNPEINPVTGQQFRPFRSGAQTFDQLYQQLGINPQLNYSDFQGAIDPLSGQPNLIRMLQMQQNAANSSGGMLPELNQSTRNQLDQIYNPMFGQINMQFDQDRERLLNDLFGRGMNASSAATDAGGRLLFGRDQVTAQLMGERAREELALRQKLQEDMVKAGAGGGSPFGFSGGGGVGTNIGPGFSALNAVLTEIDPMRTDRPINFEQQLALQDQALKRMQIQGQLGLGGRELDIQRELGLGNLGLGRQELGQGLLQFLLGQGMQRQQLAGGMAQNEMSRLMQYLMGQQQLIGGLGQNAAQIESQRRSMLGNILGGIMGGLGSFVGLGGFGGIRDAFRF